MSIKKERRQMLQWHPAFYATTEIELTKYKKDLLFETEHQLNSKPLQIDLVIVKKRNVSIEKNFGRIFRKYNLMEYKGVSDYLSIDDFYKVSGYACLYKALSEKENAIKADQITVSFVCHKYPRKMVKHLECVRGCRVYMAEQGIYYIEGAMFATQLVVTSQLSQDENLLLGSLTDALTKEKKERLAELYEKNRNNYLYDTVMDVIIRANQALFDKERENMCDALRELWKDDLEAARKEAIKEGLAEGREAGLAEGLAEGRAEGIIRMISLFMEKQKLSFEEVCNLCDIPREEWNRYKEAMKC